jgi:hypothetical protein
MKRESFSESLLNILLPLGLIFGLVLLLNLNVGQSKSVAASQEPIELKTRIWVWLPNLICVTLGSYLKLFINGRLGYGYRHH